jgi:hypothetical protein
VCRNLTETSYLLPFCRKLELRVRVRVRVRVRAIIHHFCTSCTPPSLF